MALLFLLLICPSWTTVLGDHVQDQISLLQHIMQSFQAEMTHVTERLHKVEGELSVTTDELNAVKYELRQAEDEIEALKNQSGCGDVKPRLESLEVTENITKEGVIVLKIELDQAKSEIEQLKSHLGVNLTKTDAGLQSELESLTQAAIECKNNSYDLAFMKSEIAMIRNDLNNITESNVSNVRLTAEIKDLKFRLFNMTTMSERSFNVIQTDINSNHDRTDLLNQLIDSMNNTLRKIEQEVFNISTDDRTCSCKSIANTTDLINKDELSAAFEVVQSMKKSGWTTLNFDTVKLNVGEAYNATTGIFTAPVGGLYLFWADIDISYGGIDYNELYLMKNSHIAAKGYAEISPSIDQNVISLMAVLHLRPRDEVHFEMMATYFALEGSGRSSYGGAYIGGH